MGFLRASTASTGTRLTQPLSPCLGEVWRRSGASSVRSPDGSAFSAEEARDTVNTGTGPRQQGRYEGAEEYDSSKPDSRSQAGVVAGLALFLALKANSPRYSG